MSPEEELTKLNIVIGEAEKKQGIGTFDRILVKDFLFRRTNGKVVNKETYLEELTKPENTYEYLYSEDIKVNVYENVAFVSLNVRAKGKRGKDTFEGTYRNIRIFQKGEQGWQCHRWFNEPLESLSIKDAYTLYEEGKKRRYGLLFAVNGGAFAIAQLLNSTGNKLLGDLSLAHLAIDMGIFTILTVWDTYAFGEKMRDRFCWLSSAGFPVGSAIVNHQLDCVANSFSLIYRKKIKRIAIA